MKEKLDSVPDDFFVIFDYGVSSTAAMVDYADIILHHLKQCKQDGTSVIVQIIKVKNPREVYQEDTLREYLNDCIIIGGVQCPIFSSLERCSLLRAFSKIIPYYGKSKLTIFCNSDDRWLVKYFIKKQTAPRLAVITSGLFRESVITQVPKMFFEVIEETIEEFKRGLRHY